MIVGVLLGAGERPRNQTRSELRKLVAEALDYADEICRSPNVTVQDVVVAVGSFLEDAPLTNAGTGSELTRAGTVECDASLVSFKNNRRSQASVGCLSGVRYPSQAAKLLLDKVIEESDSPMARPVFMVGEGATQYALNHGLEASDLVTPNARRVFEYWSDQMQKVEIESSNQQQRKLKEFMAQSKAPEVKSDSPYQDTIGVLAIDEKSGDVAACSSSGGTLLKLPGRVGPAAVPGAACDVMGDSLAVASGFGDDMIACTLARTACLSELDELPTVIKSQHMQRDPYYGVLKASRTEAGWLMEAAHTTETMVYGWVGPNKENEVKISDVAGVYGSRIAI